MVKETQGFPNSRKGRRVVVNPTRGGLEILLGGFFIGWRKPEEEWIWQFESFPKLKTVFCGYWTSIKTKISMTRVSKEYQMKTKMVQEQWLQLKMMFLLGYNLKTVIKWDDSLLTGEGNQNLVERRSLLEWIFPGGGMRKFSASRGGDCPPSLHSRENPETYSLIGWEYFGQKLNKKVCPSTKFAQENRYLLLQFTSNKQKR